jgi:3-hydroxyisobutyrate dehydrogenase-like beta-hydroxyacid dehydrogenase
MSGPCRVGWIGLGAIGLPMAMRLVAAGHDVRTCGHRNRDPVDQLCAAGAVDLASPRAVAEGADVVVSVVRDERQTDTALRGAGGVLAGIEAGAVLVVMSTLGPGYCRVLARECEEVGVGFLDAPVSGGPPAAAAGSLTIMVGGEPGTLDRCRPILETLGQHVFRLGGVGAGQQAKIVNNAIKVGIVGLTTEGLALGARAGLDPDVLLGVLAVSTASSQVVDRWAYYYRFKLEHRPGGPLEILHKDTGYALELADELAVEVPLLRTAAGVDVGRLIHDGDRAVGSPGEAPA